MKTAPTRFLVLFAAGLALPLAACGAGEPDPGPGPDPSAPLYDPAHLVEVRITIDPADWDALRNETRSISDIFGDMCLADPFGSPFNYYAGTVTIDGETLANVGVRKKGFLGSLDTEKPSLKLKFDEFVPGTELFGLDRVTLNNSKSDASYVNQCIAYSVFAAAGVPAPRCNFAHVVVNGADAGLYVNVEAIDKELLRRFYDDDEGNLYEGTLSDFRDGWTNTFEKKTNEDDPDRSDLERVTSALAAPDAELAAALDQTIDLDEFLSFWATEVVILHADGYSGNTNNFLVYHDPTTDRFAFLPWGTDYVMRTNPFQSAALPTSVMATGAIAWRLYGDAFTRGMYEQRLREVLDTAWNESALLADIDRMEALITPVADPDGSAGLAAEIEVVREFVRGRRAAILAEIDAGAPDWPLGLRDEPCFEILGNVSGTFDTTFDANGDQDPFSAGTGTLAGTLEVDAMFQTVAAAAGFDQQNPTDPSPQVAVLGLRADGTVDVVLLAIVPELFLPGTTLNIDFTNVFGGVFNIDPATGVATTIGWIISGTVTLDEASAVEGAAVSGSYAGNVALLAL